MQFEQPSCMFMYSRCKQGVFQETKWATHFASQDVSFFSVMLQSQTV